MFYLLTYQAQCCLDFRLASVSEGWQLVVNLFIKLKNFIPFSIPHVLRCYLTAHHCCLNLFDPAT